MSGSPPACRDGRGRLASPLRKEDDWKCRGSRSASRAIGRSTSCIATAYGLGSVGPGMGGSFIFAGESRPVRSPAISTEDFESSHRAPDCVVNRGASIVIGGGCPAPLGNARWLDQVNRAASFLTWCPAPLHSVHCQCGSLPM